MVDERIKDLVGGLREVGGKVQLSAELFNLLEGKVSGEKSGVGFKVDCQALCDFVDEPDQPSPPKKAARKKATEPKEN